MYLIKSDNNLYYEDLDFERMKVEGNLKRKGKRDDFERDYGRIIHSSAFRRLQGKTQVFGPSEGDFHRTRLTHTLEVSQIARGISIFLNEKIIKEKSPFFWIDTSLIEAAALAHDIGHPPYGHQGERALNRCVLEATNKESGFEGNAHTIRLLTSIENNGEGLNLTRATLLSLVKYPVLFDDANNNEKCFEIDNPPKASFFKEEVPTFNWLTKNFTDEESRFFLKKTENKNKHFTTENKTMECSIMEIADDIAYVTHDLQDVIKFKLLEKDVVLDLLNDYAITTQIVSDFKEKNLSIEDVIRNLINVFINQIEITTTNEFFNNRLKYNASLSKEAIELITKINDELIFKKVINQQRIQTMEYKGKVIVKKLFDAFNDETKLLPKSNIIKIEKNPESKARIIADYIAGMTDQYAEIFYKRLYESNSGRLFDI